MTFLKTLGQLILKGVQIWLGFAPIVSQQVGGGVVQKVSRDLAEIARIVVDMEALGQQSGMPGTERAKAAGPLVAQIILDSTLLSGGKIAQPDLFAAACVTIAGGVADVLNSLHADGIKVGEDATQHHLPV